MRAVFAFFLLASSASLFAQAAAYQINTIAGSAYVGDGGPATSAILAQAEGIVFDAAGNLYVADAGNHRVRRIVPSGTISTVAGTGIAGFSGDGGPAASAQLNSPYGLMIDGAGDLLIADLGNARIRKVTPDGNISTVAGGGSLAPGGVNAGSPAISVALNAPRNLAPDGAGGFYISDFGASCVYRVASDGSLTVAAGTGIRGDSGDGAAAVAAQLSYPAGIATDRNGSLYIADSGNHVVRKVAGGVISTFAHAATPTGVTVDSFGIVYIADPSAGEIIAVPPSGAVSGDSFAASDLAFGLDGYLYATSGGIVERISFAGASLVIAGGGSLAYGDGGPATSALLDQPSGVAADSSGNVYIADRVNNRIRRIAPDGTISTIAGTGAAGNSGDGGAAIAATFNAPSAVTLDPLGNLWVVDSGNQRVRFITPAGFIYAFNAGVLLAPVYAIADASGDVFISDAGNGTIVKAASNGAAAALVTGLQSPAGLALDASGDLYFVDAGAKSVNRWNASGIASFAAGTWISPRGIVLGSAGDFFVADAGLNAIVHVDSSGNAATVAGTGAAGFSGDGGPALAAELSSPWALCLDSNGALDIADLANNRIRRIVPQAQTAISIPLTLVNAASLQPGPIAPGMLVDLLGTGLSAADAPDTQVLFGSVAMPVLALDSTSLVVETPASLAGSSVTIQVIYNGTAIGQVLATVAPAAPAFFTTAGGQVSALNEDGTINSPSDPAAFGSVLVLYGTGEGVDTLPVNVTIGGYPATVLYSGPVAGYAGLWQLNVVLPSGYIPPGSMSVFASAGPFSTPPGATISLN